MPEFNGLIPQYAREFQCVPNDFRSYIGERVRGAIATMDGTRWYLLKQSDVGSWKAENLSPGYITSHGTEIDLAFYQIDNLPFKKEHFYGETSSPINPKYKFKKLIILGAGASYDCLSSENTTLPKLPLSNSIFKSDTFGLINQFYPAVQRKYSSMGVAENLEVYLTKRWERLLSKTRRDELSELMNIQFYLHHLFLAYSNLYFGNNDCNYRALIEAIDEYCEDTGEKLAVISYNYDCIFEQAMESKYGRMNSLRDYIANDSRPISLFKPHGSCDWVRPIENKHNRRVNASYRDRPDNDVRITSLAKGLFDQQFTLADIHDLTEDELVLYHTITREKVKYFQKDLKPSDYKTERCYWPNMLLPYNKKDEFIMPNFHVFHLDEVLTQVEEILIIGWKGEEAAMEKKFKEKLGDRRIKVNVIGRKPDDKLQASKEDTNQNLVKMFNANIVTQKIGFSGFIKKVVNDGELFSNKINEYDAY